MTSASYAPPVDRLLTYGDCRKYKEWPNYVAELGLKPEHIPDLIRMLTDEALIWAESDSDEVWSTIHAWRSLGQLKAEDAIAPLLNLFEEMEDVDWVSTEMPRVFQMIGPVSISALSAYLVDSQYHIYARTTAADCISEIGQHYPEARTECVNVITQQLALFASNHGEFNAFLVANLISLQAVESADVIEQAFAANCVIPFIAGDWGEVQVAMGLKTREEIPERRFTHQEMRDYFSSNDQTVDDSKNSRGFAPGAKLAKKKSGKTSRKKKK
ncbi:hypothetical protein HCG51_31130 [Tolypothrix sp. PCC 7910]|uniref:hypothetical protein n=1 Tax=Tolypothrix sp. PCC 7910 TaxID=2099387 RepID=UPI001427A0A2|nr:hypothetical protein [Tolypothrix sp. PCC 7910]QIR40710.1 hypothetical protein HCG51_31130 [Tolypothrix sp. PCC 7910]